MKNKRVCNECLNKILNKYDGVGAVLVKVLSPKHRYWLCPACAVFGKVKEGDKRNGKNPRDGRRIAAYGRNYKKTENKVGEMVS